MTKLVIGPKAHICDLCVRRGFDSAMGIDSHGTLLDITNLGGSEAKGRRVTCSFCGKHTGEVKEMLRDSIGVNRICDECLDLCDEIIEESKRKI